MIHGSQACEICAEAVSYLDYLTQKDSGQLVCRSYECNRLIKHKLTLTPALFSLYLKFEKNLLRERVEKRAEEKKRLEGLKLAQATENQRIQNAYLARNSQCSADTIRTLSIPTGKSEITELSQQRQTNYRTHLREIIEQASKYSDAGEIPEDEHHRSTVNLNEAQRGLDDNSELRAISDSVCKLCRGGCCCDGADAAYISALTVRTYMDSNPDMSEVEVLESYLGKLEPYSIDGACINQTDTGCALPRDMRSTICNEYYCDALKAYQKEAASGSEVRQVLVVQRANTNWMQLAQTPANRITGAVLVTPKRTQAIAIEGQACHVAEDASLRRE